MRCVCQAGLCGLTTHKKTDTHITITLVITSIMITYPSSFSSKDVKVVPVITAFVVVVYVVVGIVCSPLQH